MAMIFSYETPPLAVIKNLAWKIPAVAVLTYTLLKLLSVVKELSVDIVTTLAAVQVPAIPLKPKHLPVTVAVRGGVPVKIITLH